MPVDPLLSEAFIHGLAPRFSWRDPWSSHRVLGRRLRPFCAWHKLLLESIDSPLLEGRCPLPLDLRRAVAICRCRFREARVAPLGGVFDWWRLAGGGFAREVARFDAYVRDFQVRPEYAVIEPDRPEGAPPRPMVGETPPPETLRLIGDVLDYTKWVDWRIWELPLGEMLHYQALYERARLAGSGARQDWMNEAEREFQRKLKEKEAAEQEGEH